MIKEKNASLKWIFLILGLMLFFSVIYFFNSKNQSLSLDRNENHPLTIKSDQAKRLDDQKLKIEVSLVEDKERGAKFHIYFFDEEKPIPPSDVQFKLRLLRINREEEIPFEIKNDHLESLKIIEEPHSFKVDIEANYQGKTYSWEYENYESRVELSEEAIKKNGIQTEIARPLKIDMKLKVMGKIIPDEEATVHISPRFPGVVKAVNKKLGDRVKKGDILATIESNESLQNYHLTSEIDGIVLKKEMNIGMYLSGQETVFVISNLKTVYAEFNIYRHDLEEIKIGNEVEIKSLNDHLKTSSKLSYIASVGDENTQSVLARAPISNPDETWKPGLFVSGEILVDQILPPVVIKDSALQRMNNLDVVFINVGNTFEIAPVKLGRRNPKFVEVISGLSNGDRYVVENSFILKADIEKSGALHEH